MKPLLLIDVDGPLNPTMSRNAAEKAGYRRHNTNPLTESGHTWRDQYGRMLPVFMNRAHGTALLDLTDVFELVWATTWEQEANVWISPLLGLPELPVIEFADRQYRSLFRGDGTYFKTHVVAQHVKGHAFAWIDDEVGEHDERYFADEHDAPFLLRTINPFVGLVDGDFKALREWAEGVTDHDRT